MKQVFHNYILWECYKNGMWRKETKEYEDKYIPIATEFTGNHMEYGKSMIDVINNWKYSVEHHLTDTSINRRAYIGHSAVNFKFGIPEYITRIAWGYLDEEQQRLANLEADNAIKLFENKLKGIEYGKGLFG